MVTRRTVRRALAAAVGLLLAGSIGPAAPDLSAQQVPDVTSETIDRWMTELSNRGRWGADDELGTLNLITPQHRVRAAGLVREGITVSLSHDYLKERAADATSPWSAELLGNPAAGYLSDRYTIAYHGYAHSHMDALCHNSLDGVMYNGFSRTSVDSTAGCTRLGITNAKQGIVSRGVLMDIARLRGRPHGSRSPRVGDAMAARARRRDARQRLHQRRPAFHGRGGLTARPSADARGDGHVALRQPGPRSARGDRGGPEPMGVHVRGGAACGAGRHRGALESLGGVLAGGDAYAQENPPEP
ncbi:MAG: hypothetical protein OEO79_12250 [Gemmatimonadota bacterium]|nr:hypothetical protein [Gemmatimonadota bacterium]